MNDNNEKNSNVTQLLAIRNELKGIAQKIDKLSNQDTRDDNQGLLLGRFKPLSLIIILISASIFASIMQTLLITSLINKTTSLINKPKSYEYQVFSPSDISFTTDMDIQGSQGWKVVNCRRASDRITDTFGYECIMMREK